MLLRFTIREGNCTDSLRVLSDTITVVVSTYCVHCIDVTYCYYRCHTYWRVCACVCVGHTPMSPAKTTDPVKMLFGGRLLWAPETMC